MTARRTLCAVLAASFLVASAAPAEGPPKPASAPSASAKEEARTRLAKGLHLYEQGSFDAALSELQRAYELAPSYKLLYNIGLVYRALNDDAGALRAFTQYLDDGGKDVPAKRRTEVERQLSELKSLVATVAITTNVDGAEIAVDDVVIGKSPLAAPAVVNAGRRKISATKAGLTPVGTVITVAGQDTKKIELAFDLPSAPASASAAPPPPPPPHEGSRSHVPWIGWAATGVLATGAIVTGAIALSSSRELKTERDNPTTRADLDSARSKTKTFALVTDVLTGAAIVAGGVSLYLTLKKDDANEPKTEIGLGPGTIHVRGAF